MKIHVNGESKTFKEGDTVSDILQSLNIQPEQVAIELNLKILERRDFPATALSEGDSVEILSFFGGGATT